MENSEDTENCQHRDGFLHIHNYADADSGVFTSDNETCTVPATIQFENTEASSNETLENFDSESWNSDTPLLSIGNEANENKPPERVSLTEKSETDTNIESEMNIKNEYLENAHTIVGIEQPALLDQLKESVSCLGSNLSIAYSIFRDIEVVQANPVHVFGSSWELGSVCSINLHGAADIYKSQAISVEGCDPALEIQDRLLHQMFKEKIGSVHLDPILFDKSIKSSDIDGMMEIRVPVKTKNLKNVLILSTGIMLLHIAVFGLRNLQSSINSKDGLGVYSLATLFGAFTFGSLASPYFVQRYRPKLCLSVSCFGHLVYVVANYYPNFYVIIPASVIYGLSNALLWNALCTYITELGLYEAFLKNKISSNVLSRYFGIFFLALQMSMVVGNLISSIIFSQSDTRNRLQEDSHDLSETFYNSTMYAFTNSSSTGLGSNQALARPKCGAAHCDVISVSQSNPPVGDLDKVFLIGTYSCCDILSILVIQCFLDKLPNYMPNNLTVREAMKQAVSVVAMVIDPKFCFIVLLCLYTLMSNGFVVADVLKAFITCPLGVRMVGYSMICFGICGSVSSYIFGKLTKCCGILPAFVVASVMNVCCLALMTTWEPTSDDQYWLFALIGAWGFADGIWQSQINSLISSMFVDRYETAFGCCRLLQGLAGIIVFTLSNMLCMMSKLVFTTAVCILSTVLYVIMEIIGRTRRTSFIQSELSMKYKISNEKHFIVIEPRSLSYISKYFKVLQKGDYACKAEIRHSILWFR